MTARASGEFWRREKKDSYVMYMHTHTFCCIDIDVYRCRCRCRSRHRRTYAHRDLPKLCKSFSAKLPPQTMVVQAEFLKMSGRSRYDNQPKNHSWHTKDCANDSKNWSLLISATCHLTLAFPVFFSWMQIHSPWSFLGKISPPPERFLVENQVQLAIVRTGSRWVGLGDGGFASDQVSLLSRRVFNTPR